MSNSECQISNVEVKESDGTEAVVRCRGGKGSSQMTMSFDVLVGDCRVDVVDRKVVAVWGGGAVF